MRTSTRSAEQEFPSRNYSLALSQTLKTTSGNPACDQRAASGVNPTGTN